MQSLFNQILTFLNYFYLLNLLQYIQQQNNLSSIYIIFQKKIYITQSPVVPHSKMKLSITHQPQKYKPSNQTTIAQLNKVSIRQSKYNYNPQTPFRIRLPQYFNIPTFQDKQLIFDTEKQNKVTIINKQDAVFKKRMKDLSILAQGMKRAKNIKQQSRYYFTQGVLLHNTGQYMKSIEYFQKFLKIVIYLQDNKSIELALNVIGCAYMYLNNYQKSIQFHNRQSQVSQRSDKFISLINIGLCNQLNKNNKQAQQYYRQAQQILDLSDKTQQNQIRQQLLNQLTNRVQLKNRYNNQLFMTQNIINKSPSKTIQNSILKQQSSILMKKITTRKQYEQNKFKYAIHTAQQNIQQHLKSSIKFQTP